MADDPPPEGEPSSTRDVVLLTGPTADGEGVRVVRARGDQLDAGEVRPLQDGKPLVSGEIVKLAPRAGRPRVFDVQVLAKVDAPPTSEAVAPHKGPPKVSTAAYRESWERIFGGEAEKTLN